MISVAMATFNSKKYIIEQLNSIVSQTVKVDEVVICDDCSSDDTVDIIQQFINKNGLKNWRLYCHVENKGFINTFQDALRETKGDIIVLCDHDDEWFPDKIEIILAAFNKNPKILSLATSFVRIDENGAVNPIIKRFWFANNNLIKRRVVPKKLNQMFLKDVTIYNITPGCTMAVKRELVLEYIVHDYKMPHDWALNVIAACKDGLYYLDRPTTYYRIHSKNTIGLRHINDYDKRLKILLDAITEKTECLDIISRYIGTNNKEYKYAKRLKSITEKRYNGMVNMDILEILHCLVFAIPYKWLIENVGLDLYCAIRSKVKVFER